MGDRLGNGPPPVPNLLSRTPDRAVANAALARGGRGSGRFFVVFLVAMFTLELGIMAVLPRLVPQGSHPLAAAVVDAAVLTAVLAPLVWFGFVRPVQQLHESRGLLLDEFLSAQDDERRRIAADLHALHFSTGVHKRDPDTYGGQDPDHVIPPVPVRQWVISVPKILGGRLADRPAAVNALTKIFLDEIERLLCAAAGVTRDADAPASARPRLGGILLPAPLRISAQPSCPPPRLRHRRRLRAGCCRSSV